MRYWYAGQGHYPLICECWNEGSLHQHGSGIFGADDAIIDYASYACGSTTLTLSNYHSLYDLDHPQYRGSVYIVSHFEDDVGYPHQDGGIFSDNDWGWTIYNPGGSSKYVCSQYYVGQLSLLRQYRTNKKYYRWRCCQKK